MLEKMRRELKKIDFHKSLILHKRERDGIFYVHIIDFYADKGHFCRLSKSLSQSQPSEGSHIFQKYSCFLITATVIG
jgi:hypothetical protein